MAHNIFGVSFEDFPDYDVEVLVNHDRVAAVYEYLQRIEPMNPQRRQRNKLLNLLKAAGVTLATARTLAYAWYNNRIRHEDPGGVESFPSKRLRGEAGAVTSKSTPDDADLKHKPPSTAPPPTTPPVKEVEIDSGGVIVNPARPNGPPESGKVTHAHSKPTAKTTPTTMADIEMKGPTSKSADPSHPNQPTPISRFSNAFEGIPRQYTTVLPYEKTLLSQSLGTSAGSLNRMYLLRLNSIYDIFKTAISTANWTANPDPTADAADATAGQVIEQPYWRDHWAQYWEYWTVVECRWKIILCNTTPTGKRSLAMFYGYTGIQQPPLLESGTSGTDITYDTFRRWKGFNKVVANPNMTAGSNVHSNDDKNVVIVSGVYHPGDGSHEVVEDELVETWVRGDAVPKEQNTMCVIITRPPLNDSGTSACTFDLRFEFEYVVQYKDQKVQWHFPTASLTSNFQKKDTTVA